MMDPIASDDLQSRWFVIHKALTSTNPGTVARLPLLGTAVMMYSL